MAKEPGSNAVAPFSISAAAEKTGLTPRQIRYYEKMGLIKPHRTAGNQRRYSDYHIHRLLRIKQLLQEHHTIDGIKEILATEAKKAKMETDVVLPSEQIDAPNPLRPPLGSVFPVSNRAALQEILQRARKKSDHTKNES